VEHRRLLRSGAHVNTLCNAYKKFQLTLSRAETLSVGRHVHQKVVVAGKVKREINNELRT
jgi:hypothetical protein